MTSPRLAEFAMTDRTRLARAVEVLADNGYRASHRPTRKRLKGPMLAVEITADAQAQQVAELVAQADPGAVRLPTTAPVR